MYDEISFINLAAASSESRSSARHVTHSRLQSTSSGAGRSLAGMIFFMLKSTPASVNLTSRCHHHSPLPSIVLPASVALVMYAMKSITGSGMRCDTDAYLTRHQIPRIDVRLLT